MCEATSKDDVKLALNLVHFLFSKEECQTMTVYGQGHGKTAMPEYKRRALRSK